MLKSLTTALAARADWSASVATSEEAMCRLVLGAGRHGRRVHPTKHKDVTDRQRARLARRPEAGRVAGERPRPRLQIGGHAAPRRDFTAAPRSAGLFTTVTPAASSAAIFSAAVPLPPEMMAPAWPMRRPGGAVWPAMKPTTGFLNAALIQAAASCSALPPISPIITTASVSVVAANSVSASMKLVPISGSPPMPMHEVCPSPSCVSW